MDSSPSPWRLSCSSSPARPRIRGRERDATRAERPEPALSFVSLDVALLASVAAIFVLTLFPIDDATEVQLVPFGDIAEALTPPLQAEEPAHGDGERPAFVPFGVVLALRGFRLGAAALLGFALSSAVELTQLLFVSGRTTSVDDLLLNTLGCGAWPRVGDTLAACAARDVTLLAP